MSAGGVARLAGGSAVDPTICTEARAYVERIMLAAVLFRVMVVPV